MRSGSGDAIVFLPTDTKIKAKFNSGNGDVENAFGDTKDAFEVSFTTGSGDLTIKKK